MLEMIVGNGVYVSLILLFVIIILLRVFYALTVNSNAKRRDLDNPVFWTFSPFCSACLRSLCSLQLMPVRVNRLRLIQNAKRRFPLCLFLSFASA